MTDREDAREPAAQPDGTDGDTGPERTGTGFGRALLAVLPWPFAHAAVLLVPLLSTHGGGGEGAAGFVTAVVVAVVLVTAAVAIPVVALVTWALARRRHWPYWWLTLVAFAFYIPVAVIVGVLIRVL